MLAVEARRVSHGPDTSTFAVKSQISIEVDHFRNGWGGQRVKDLRQLFGTLTLVAAAIWKVIYAQACSVKVASQTAYSQACVQSTKSAALAKLAIKLAYSQAVVQTILTSSLVKSSLISLHSNEHAKMLRAAAVVKSVLKDAYKAVYLQTLSFASAVRHVPADSAIPEVEAKGVISFHGAKSSSRSAAGRDGSAFDMQHRAKDQATHTTTLGMETQLGSETLTGHKVISTKHPNDVMQMHTLGIVAPNFHRNREQSNFEKDMLGDSRRKEIKSPDVEGTWRLVVGRGISNDASERTNYCEFHCIFNVPLSPLISHLQISFSILAQISLRPSLMIRFSILAKISLRPSLIISLEIPPYCKCNLACRSLRRTPTTLIEFQLLKSCEERPHIAIAG